MTLGPASEPTLQCPYPATTPGAPSCPGTLPTTGDEVKVCPTCQRLSARCPRESGRGRCLALNRPLARFCRRCGLDLGPNWARTVWDRDALGSRGRVLRDESARLGPPRVVFRPADDPRLGPDWHGPFEMVQAGDWLWIGGTDGRFLLLEPFRDRAESERVILEHAWPESPPAPLRACTDGPWLVLHGPYGLKWVDLLALDDAPENEPATRTLWRPSAGQGIVAGPVLSVAGLATGVARDVVWVVADGDGLALASTRLPAPDGGRPVVRLDRIDPARIGTSATRMEDAASTVWLDAPRGRPGPVVLGAPGGIFVVDPAGPTAALRRIWDQPPLDARSQGLVFVSGESGAAERLCVACHDRQGPALYLLDPRPDGRPPVRAEGAAVPLDVVALPGRTGALCRDGAALVVCDPVGHVNRVATLPAAAEARVHGRLAACSGIEVLGARSHWFTQLVDLVDGRLVKSFVSRLPTGPPVLIGRSLFLFEGGTHDPGAEESVQLARYPIEFVSGGGGP